jgi:hypothetical protein
MRQDCHSMDVFFEKRVKGIRRATRRQFSAGAPEALGCKPPEPDRV